MIALKTPFEFLRYFETHPIPISSSSADVRWKHFFAIFFEILMCIYYGFVLIFTLFTHLISSPSTAVHWPTPSPPSPLPQELRLINGVQDVCRIQV